MSRFFGNLMQIGYVVNDIEAAMQHWATVLGIGPWFYMPHLAIQHWCYREKPCEADISLALAQSGAIQIEFIEQHNQALSVYAHFLRRGSSGIQHHLGYGSWQFDVDMERHRMQYEIIQSGMTG